MPIVSYNNPEEEQTGPEDAPLPSHSSSCVTSDEYDLNSLIQLADGKYWTVTYYHQLLGTDDPTYPHDSIHTGVLQPYLKVENMVLRVITALPDISVDLNTTLTLEGSSLYVFESPPHAGDMFTVPLNGGRLGLFTVTTVTKRSYNLKNIYVIDYSFVVFLDTTQGQAEIQSLEDKVVRVLVYDKDTGKGLTLDEVNCIQELYVLKRTMMARYFEFFIEKESHTLIIPGQSDRYFDWYLARFITDTVSIRDFPKLMELNMLNKNFDRCMDIATIWTALMERNAELLFHCDAKMGEVDSGRIQSVRYHNIVRYGWIDKFIYPKHTNPLLPYDNHCLIADDLALVEVDPYGRNMTHLPTPGTIPLVPQVLADDFYVFSQNFYDDQTPLSALENITLQYVKGTKPDGFELLQIAKYYQHWGMLEQFYYIPILNFLINAV